MKVVNQHLIYQAEVNNISMIKICQACGKEFEATTGMQKFCNDKHYRICVICGQEFEVTRYHLTAKDAKTTCSKKCSAELRKRTNLGKYGGVAPAASYAVQAKMRATTLERYGVDHAMHSEVFKEKSKQTNLERYGVAHHAQLESERVRVSEQWKDNEFKETVASKRLQTNVERYGTTNPMQSLEVRTKCSVSKMTDSSKAQNFLEFKEDPRKFIMNLGLDYKPTLQELSSLVGVNDSTIGCYIHLHKCEDLIRANVSTMEQSVMDFLRQIKSDVVISHCDRTVITPYEIDIYLPEYKLGIECNPTATHNSDVYVFDRGSAPMSPSYHQMKTNLCESNGIRLLHIFGYEWIHNDAVIKSIIQNCIGCNTQSIYARSCEVREVSSHETSMFLKTNHRQGAVGSTIRLGLYHADRLVSIMTFGRLRATVGGSGSGYELLRFCSLLGTSVVGGASKLFKHFVCNYSPNYIRSFSDRAHTSGDLYRTLGFHEARRSSAGYCWVNLSTEMAYHRMNAQKQNIRKLLNDSELDLNKSERELMVEHGFVRVYDSGTITWEWKLN